MSLLPWPDMENPEAFNASLSSSFPLLLLSRDGDQGSSYTDLSIPSSSLDEDPHRTFSIIAEQCDRISTDVIPSRAW
eukprot:765461-Hanusia_phi.AAC.1